MVRVLVVLFTILLLNWEAVSTQMLATASPPRRHVVEIREFSFHPKRILVSPGDTIVWINRDIVPHTATASDGTWGSQDMEEGESWEMVVENSVMQPYFCDFHPNMRGVMEARKPFSGTFSWTKRRGDTP